MKHARKLMVALALTAFVLVPLPGCAGGGAGGGCGKLMGLALSVGAAVGGALLVKELS